MPSEGKRNVSFKLDAELHSEVKAFIEQNEMTIGEFMALAIDNELHPKIQVKEDKSMQNSRTLAFQVSEELFQRVKAYLKRNNMKQKDFVINLIEEELERDEALYENHDSGQDGDSSDEDEDEYSSQIDESGGEGEDSGQSDEYGDHGGDSGQDDEHGGQGEDSGQSNEYGSQGEDSNQDDEYGGEGEGSGQNEEPNGIYGPTM